MSDQQAANQLTPPVGFLDRLTEIDGRLKSTKIVIDELANLGQDVSQLQRVYDAMVQSRELLMKAFQT